MERIKFIKRPKLKNPLFIVAWPGMGEVAYKAAAYLVEKFKAEAFASVPAEEFFYLMESYVHDGILALPEWPNSKFYFHKGKKRMKGTLFFLSRMHNLILHGPMNIASSFLKLQSTIELPMSLVLPLCRRQ